MRAIFIFAWIQIKRFFRDPVALFFTLALPMIFLLVFGSIFREDSSIQFNVAIINHSESEFSEQFIDNLLEEDTFERTEVDSIDEARDLMTSREIDSLIELPAGFGDLGDQNLPAGELNVYYDEGSPEAGQTVASVLDSVLRGLNQEITNQEPLFRVVQTPTSTTGLTSFDYMVAGLLGFSILSMGIFGLAMQLPSEKMNGTMRRVQATPFTQGQLIIGTLLYYGFIGAISLIIMIVASLVIFDFDMRGDWLQLALFSGLSMIVLLGFGLLIGGYSKNENQASVFANILSFPMMFLSGVFFPRFIMPDWLQGITDYVPLTPVVDGIRFITTGGATLADLGAQILPLLIWGVVVYALAIKFFRWE